MHWAQLFKGRLALTQGQILIQVSLFLCTKVFLGKIFTNLFRTPMIEFSLKALRPELKFHTNPGLP